MPTIEHDGVTLSYDESGPAEGRPIVLLHGLTTAASTWSLLSADLSTDHRVAALDVRGHGQSGHAPGTYDLAHWSGDVVAFLEAVVGQPAVLIGHSLGGVLAAQVSMDRPELVTAVLLEDPPMFMSTADQFPTTPFADIFPMLLGVLRDLHERDAELDEYVALVSAMPAGDGTGSLADRLGPEWAALQGQALMDFDPAALASVIDGGLHDHDAHRPLDVPAVVLCAEALSAFRPEDEAPFLAANPGATVELVAGASHMIHDEQPDLYRDRVRRFIADIGQ